MANKTRIYDIQFTWKEEGNRSARIDHTVRATTVPRAISKLVAEINNGEFIPEHFPAGLGEEEPVKASHLMVLNCTTATA